ncbi:MAG: hypothetical protein WCK82_08505 [Bacteroidota bacterium]|jgi:hypothetical protein
MNHFPANIIEKIRYYVYVYVDPFTDAIFYIGKGKENRCFSHLKNLDESEKSKRIIEIKNKGSEPKIEILAFGLDEKDALRVEAAAIDLIGIKNLTNLQKGHLSDELGRKTLDDLIALFHAKPIYQFEDNCALIRISKTYKSGMPSSELYEYTRGIWKISEKTRNKLQFACCVYNGVIREVYKIEKWFPAGATFYSHRQDIASRIDSGRFEFIGNIADQKIKTQYNYRAVSHLFKRGFISPILCVGPSFNKNNIAD